MSYPIEIFGLDTRLINSNHPADLQFKSNFTTVRKRSRRSIQNNGTK